MLARRRAGLIDQPFNSPGLRHGNAHQSITCSYMGTCACSWILTGPCQCDFDVHLVSTQVDERLDAAVKRILQQNRRMAEELKIHVQVGASCQRRWHERRECKGSSIC